MKTLKTFLFVLFNFLVSFLFGQEPLTKGLVRYQILEPNNSQKGIHKHLEVYFDDQMKYISKIVESPVMNGRITFITDIINDDLYFLMELGDIKGRITDMGPPNLPPLDQPVTVSETGENSVIMKYRCRKSEVRITEELFAAVWTTDRIVPNDSLKLLTHPELSGFPLQIEFFEQGGTLKLQAIEISKDKKALDQILESYEEMTFDEFADETGLIVFEENMGLFYWVFNAF